MVTKPPVNVVEIDPETGKKTYKRSKSGKSLNPKQIRARARRKGGLDHMSKEERDALVRKPVSQWDMEELAKGRPKDKNGEFSGAIPQWVSRQTHEEAMARFKQLIRTDMNSHTILAIDTLRDLLINDDEDEKGKLKVTPSVKADVAKFLIEHLLGKPTQPVQTDINIKLQSILGDALVMPENVTRYLPSSSHRDIVDAEIVEEPGNE